MIKYFLILKGVGCKWGGVNGAGKEVRMIFVEIPPPQRKMKEAWRL